MPTVAEERFTDRARQAVKRMHEEARALNHEYTGTEHLLLAIIHEEAKGIAPKILKSMNVNPSELREEVIQAVQPGPPMVTIGKLPSTPRLKKAIEKAIEYSREACSNYVGTEHLLLGLASDNEGIAGEILTARSLSASRIQLAIAGWVDTEPVTK